MFSLKKIIFTSLLLHVLLLPVNSSIYYLSFLNGNDNNTGKDSSKAWKNCPGIDAYSGSGKLIPGDTVLFNSGDIWSITSGTQGVYLLGGVTYIGNVWGSGTRATILAKQDCEAGIVRFRDDAEKSTIFKGFVVDGNHYVGTGIDINHRYYSRMNGALKIVDNCDVKNTYSDQTKGQYKYGIIISNHGSASSYCENVEILNTRVHDVSRDGICLYPGDENADCRIKNITVCGCEVYNTGQDPNYSAGAGIILKGYVESAIIEYNYVHDTKGAGIFFNSNEDNHFNNAGIVDAKVRFNIVNCSSNHGGIRVYDMSSGADKKDLKIYDNIIMNNNHTGGFYLDNDVCGKDNKILFYNNTLFNTFVSISTPSATYTTFEFVNNIVFYSKGTPINGSKYFTKYIKNVTVNPQFNDTSKLPTGFLGIYNSTAYPNSDGLNLSIHSNAIDSGLNLGPPYNVSINSKTRPLNTGWDIGAYEKDVITDNDREKLHRKGATPHGLPLKGAFLHNLLQNNNSTNPIYFKYVKNQIQVQMFRVDGKEVSSVLGSQIVTIRFSDTENMGNVNK